jgi:hypothetical protein
MALFIVVDGWRYGYSGFVVAGGQNRSDNGRGMSDLTFWV